MAEADPFAFLGTAEGEKKFHDILNPPTREERLARLEAERAGVDAIKRAGYNAILGIREVAAEPDAATNGNAVDSAHWRQVIDQFAPTADAQAALEDELISVGLANGTIKPTPGPDSDSYYIDDEGKAWSIDPVTQEWVGEDE